LTSGKQAWPKVHRVNFAQLKGWLKARRLFDCFALRRLKRCLAATRDGMMRVSGWFNTLNFKEYLVELWL
jgi:hypothetical protein